MALTITVGMGCSVLYYVKITFEINLKTKTYYFVCNLVLQF